MGAPSITIESVRFITLQRYLQVKTLVANKQNDYLVEKKIMAVLMQPCSDRDLESATKNESCMVAIFLKKILKGILNKFHDGISSMLNIPPLIRFHDSH